MDPPTRCLLLLAGALASPAAAKAAAARRGAVLRTAGRAPEEPAKRPHWTPYKIDQGPVEKGWEYTSEKAESGAGYTTDQTKAAVGRSRQMKKVDQLRAVYDEPPQTLDEAGRRGAEILDVPTQPPVRSVAEVPGALAKSYYTLLTMNFLKVLSSLVFTLLVIGALAFLYTRFKETAASAAGRLEQGALAHAPSGMHRPQQHSISLLNQGTWRFGLFDCLEADRVVCCVACFCPSIRWADTMRMAGVYSFWVGLLVFASLLNLSSATAGVSYLVLLIVVVRKRQDLRRLFAMKEDYATMATDCCSYFCCMCCTLIQDARQMEEAYALNHPNLERITKYPLRGGSQK